MAAGTIALAFITALLGVATSWLGWHTRRMARATHEMATATQEIVRIEEERRSEELQAELIIEKRYRRYAEASMHAQVRNTQSGEATNVVVQYRKGDRCGSFQKDRVAGRADFEFPERYSAGTTSDLPADDNHYMRIHWEDARGRCTSPIYGWSGEDGTGAPDRYEPGAGQVR